MNFYTEDDGSIKVENYDYSLKDDVVIGYFIRSGKDDRFWKFHPSPGCVLNTSAFIRLPKKLDELNLALINQI